MSKRKVVIFIIGVALLITGSFIYFLISKKIVKQPPQMSEEERLEALIKSVTAPEGGSLSIQEQQRIEKLLKSVTAP